MRTDAGLRSASVLTFCVLNHMAPRLLLSWLKPPLLSWLKPPLPLMEKRVPITTLFVSSHSTHRTLPAPKVPIINFPEWKTHHVALPLITPSTAVRGPQDGKFPRHGLQRPSGAGSSHILRFTASCAPASRSGQASTPLHRGARFPLEDPSPQHAVDSTTVTLCPDFHPTAVDGPFREILHTLQSQSQISALLRKPWLTPQAELIAPSDVSI